MTALNKRQAESAKSEGLAFYEKAGPTLLSRQPDVVPFKQPKKMPGWQELRNHLEQRLSNLRAWRFSWYSQNWADLAEFILPRRSIWLTQSAGGIPSPNNMTRGREINKSIVDPTGTYAVRVCTGGMVSGLASTSRPWFKVVPSINKTNIDAAARAWFDEIEERLYAVLAGSNFYDSFTQEVEDLIVFGTAPCIIYEDEKDIIRCYNPCIGEYYLASGATMRIDGFYRQFLMTVAQIVDFFGVENCPEDIQKLWQAKGSSLDVERIIAHSIEPNFPVEGSGNDTGVVKGNFTWREVYWVYGSATDMPLSFRGFTDQPFTAARWSTQSNDAYGRSPGMDVLPDILQLQIETKRKAEAIEKQVRPPLVADMTLKNQPSSILPGHVTYVQSLGPQSGMRPIYEVRPEIKEMMEDLKEIQARIKQGFFNDLFSMLQQIPQGKMTAYETAERVNERLQIIGPVIESLNGILKQKLKRVFGILKKRGLISPPPDSLKDVPLSIEFVSILALAQKAASTGSIERLAAFIGNLVAVYPEVKDVMDPDEATREMGSLLGAPQKVLRAPEAVQNIRQVNAQKQQQAEAMNALQHSAQTASIGADAANTLAATQVGSGRSALEAMMGAGNA